MKTCDLCKTSGYGHVTLHGDYASSEVKIVCSACADIINAFCAKVESLLEVETQRFELKLSQRLSHLIVTKQQSFIKWLGISLKARFKSNRVVGAFNLTKPLSSRLEER